jgi:hypothetical protein
MKAVSPMVAVVILIALTIIIGGILSVWFTSFIKPQLGGTEETMEKQQRCGASYLKILKVENDTGVAGAETDFFRITLDYKSGSEDLYNFVFSIAGATGVGKNESKIFTEANPMAPGTMYTFEVKLDKNVTYPLSLVKVTATCLKDILVTAEKSY